MLAKLESIMMSIIAISPFIIGLIIGCVLHEPIKLALEAVMGLIKLLLKI